MNGTTDTLAICAVRHTLGRQTYFVSDVVRAVMALELDERSARVVARDVARALREQDAGADFDEREWRRLLDHLLTRWPSAGLEVEADARIFPGTSG